jgi:hypothetical protein
MTPRDRSHDHRDDGLADDDGPPAQRRGQHSGEGPGSALLVQADEAELGRRRKKTMAIAAA